MTKTHPVLKQAGFTVKTPPLKEFVSTFSELLDGGEMSLVSVKPLRATPYAT
jgi:hypothetical protein